ncbi:carboxypeptidase-like regulatory domain-containing protein [Pontibacter chinhatensis]|uniref:Carboxypeptidase regulatory-like domain-containing protein n=1 Tax=Pontibacter chinhatensis TaxID=1436961 RepID=A0A1I2Y4Q0_9BACT|nr:carboxypeptidase-like regulatory domain-containing protein [Pontibacter chinhatensis]SFH20700.1 Carboxypeptidase regulatory-like domain-containing protein [Pontibacter chinhatensis]
MKTHAGLYFVLICLVCCLASCDLHQYDYVSKYCPGSCTVIKGRVSDQNGQPVAGTTLRIKWRNDGYLQPAYTTEKATATTDMNGNYELRFLLRDSELEKGYFLIEANQDLDAYLGCKADNLWYPRSLARDTTIIQNYTIASFALLEFTTDNQDPEQPPQERYQALVKYKLSPTDTDSCTYAFDGRWGYLRGEVYVPADIPVVVYTSKAGTGMTKKDVLTLESGERRRYTLTF